MPAQVDLDATFTVGEAWFSSTSPDRAYAVVFEDDGETAYFYACRAEGSDGIGAILDALHI